eukprot:6741308-Prorocentrum_lima.AAC.1
MDLALSAKRGLSPGEPATQPSPAAKSRGLSAPIPRGVNIPAVVEPVGKARPLSPPMPPPLSPETK